jgi:hypothetical protein
MLGFFVNICYCKKCILLYLKKLKTKQFMKLEKVLDNLNSFEKNSFLKILDNIISSNPKNYSQIEKILSDNSRDLKNIDNINIARVFSLIETEYTQYVKNEFINSTSQLDILIDIISRDGNCIMKIDWFSRLYDKELSCIEKKLKEFKDSIDSEKPEYGDHRQRDYKIYKACLNTAYYNDSLSNLDNKITKDEQSILITLSNQLGLSQEEVKLMNYLIIPTQKLDIDSIVNELKSVGIVFFSKKNNTIYVADEIVRVLRKVRGKELADKFYRRVLRLLRDPQINTICKLHRIDWRLPIDLKIKEIINEGVSFSGLLINDIHKEGTKLLEKKKFINDFFEKNLGLTNIKGVTIEEKIENLIKYFEETERDEKVGISIDGYEKLLVELNQFIPALNNRIRSEFELQEEQVLKSHYLLDYNMKPRDILEMVTEKELEEFCKTKSIKTRGDVVLNILDAYKDTENLHLENYENIGFRNISALKENGLLIKEADLGVKFEELTKTILTKLGFQVDEVLRKKMNTNKDQIDIVINLGNSEIILVECKTNKESGYNKFSSVSRQLKAYTNLAKINDHKVIKSLLIAPDFSDDFIKECGLEYELNLSLIKASSLVTILEGFKNSKLKVFPYNLLMRDVLIQEDRILKAIEK